ADRVDARAAYAARSSVARAGGAGAARRRQSTRSPGRQGARPRAGQRPRARGVRGARPARAGARGVRDLSRGYSIRIDEEFVRAMLVRPEVNTTPWVFRIVPTAEGPNGVSLIADVSPKNSPFASSGIATDDREASSGSVGFSRKLPNTSTRTDSGHHVV